MKHREDGPAVLWISGGKEWYINGKRHREDGSAVEWADGTKLYYIDGKKLTKQEFKNYILKKNLEEIMK